MNLNVPIPLTREFALFAFHLFKITSLIIVVALCACVVQCGPTPLSETATRAQYERWFVSSDPEVADSLARFCHTCEQLQDVLDRTARALAPLSGAGIMRPVDRTGTPFTIGTYCPATLDTKSPAPLIVYLHGGIGSATNDKGRMAWDMFRPLADSLGILLASPSADRKTPWWSPSGINRILMSVRLMALRYNVDRDRVILAGVSDGALGCYAVASTVPAPFAGFVAISGFGGLLPRVGIPIMPVNLMQRPIYVVHGELDRIYPVTQVREFVRQLRQQGVGIQLREYPAENHGFDYRRREFASIAALVQSWRLPKHTSIAWQTTPGFPQATDNLIDVKPFDSTRAVTVSAYWRGDTLMISSRNAKKLLYASGARSNNRIMVRTNGGSARTVSPLKHPFREQLDVSMQQCVPTVQCSDCYLIKVLSPTEN